MLKNLNNFFNFSRRFKKIRLLLEGYGYSVSSKEDVIDHLKSFVKEVEHNEAYTKTILDSLPHATWLKDKKGRFIHVNQLFLRSFNLSFEKVIGKTVHEVFPEQLAIFYDEGDDEAISSGETVFREYDRNGRVYESYKSPVVDQNGHIIGTTGIEHDITEKKRLYEYFSKERNYLQALLDNVPYSIYFKDTNFKFTKINRAQAEVLGVDNSDDAIGKTDHDFFEIHHAEAARKDEEKIIQTGIPLVGKIEHVKKSEGEYIWVSSTKVIIKDDDDKITGIVGMSIDITRQIETETELKLAKSKAEEADKLKSAFLANISHEIRTPMNGIIGFSDLLRNRNITGDERELYLGHIEKSSKALLNLIEDIIDVSRIEANQLKLYSKPINLPELIDDAYIEIKKELQINNKANIQLISKIPEGHKDFQITTDEGRLRQVLNKILHNAVKFTEKGAINFGYSLTDDQQILFFVKDTGYGIPVEKVNLIFEQFGQIIEHRKMDHPGTGMGLSISYQLVKLMGGNMWVESNVGEGSTFFISIPLEVVRQNENKTEKSLNTQNQTFDWKGKRILIAEDEELNYLYMNEILRINSPILDRVKNGAEALKYCKDNDPDLVLMDVKMPVMDGYIATREIKKIKPQIPIIAQTAYALEDERERSIEAGCNDYISKPINREKLFKIIDQHIH